MVGELGGALRAAGFDQDGWDALVDEMGCAPPAQALRAVGRVREACLATLFESFVLGRPVSRRAFQGAMPTIDLEQLEREGVLACDRGSVRARVALGRHAGMIVAGDHKDDTAADVVQTVTAASKTLGGLTVREPIEAALDLGTGSGMHALLATRHAERVVATDVNARALSFARLSQRLNHVDNVEWREGRWFEPVAGESFDLITCNPPYVISPDRRYVYRDTDEGADALCRRLVRQSAEHLTEGGFATLLVNWTHREADAWSAPLRGWLSGLRCDAVLLRYSSVDPLAYAVAWNRQLEAREPERFEQTVMRWVQHYQRAGIERVGTGAVVLRRRSVGAAPWVTAFEPARRPGVNGGQQLRRIFAAGASQAARVTSHAVLEGVWRLVEKNQLEQALTFADGAYVPQPASLFFDDGIGLGAPIDPRVLGVLFALDGRTPLRELLRTGAVTEGSDESNLVNLCERTFKELIERGFLVPASD
jgi:methylase of polypeptide subunit release factors